MDGIEERLACGCRVLLLVRHGRTAWNAEGRFLGRTDIPLDEVGRAQAAALGDRWRGRLGGIWSSPSRRAISTALELGNPRVHPGLAEVGHGALEGQTLADGVRSWPQVFQDWDVDPTTTRLPGGESLGEARDRVVNAIEGVVGEGLLAVVSHQLTLSALLATFAGAPLRDWRRFALPPAGCRWISFDGRQWELGPKPEAEAGLVRPSV